MFTWTCLYETHFYLWQLTDFSRFQHCWKQTTQQTIEQRSCCFYKFYCENVIYTSVVFEEVPASRWILILFFETTEKMMFWGSIGSSSIKYNDTVLLICLILFTLCQWGQWMQRWLCSLTGHRNNANMSVSRTEMHSYPISWQDWRNKSLHHKWQVG